MNESNDNSAGPGASETRYPVRDMDAEELRSSKRRFWWSLAGLIGAVFAFDLYLQVTFSYDRYWEGYLAAALGGSTATLLMSGVVPMLWFAVLARFNYRRSVGPLVLWYLLALIVMGMSYSAESFHHCLESRSMQECLSQ